MKLPKFFIILLILIITSLIISCSENTTNPPIEELNDITNPPGESIIKLAINSQKEFFALTNTGLFISIDRGSNWDTLTQSLNPNLQVGDILFTSNGDIFISCGSPYNGASVLRSTDSGNSWTISWSYPSLLGIRAFPIEVDANDNIYICADGLNKSSDLGNTWKVIYQWSSLGICLPNDSTIVIGVPGPFPGQIVYSTDSGITWDSTGYSIYILEFYLHNLNIFAGGWSSEGGGVHKSMDGGMSWQLCGFSDLSVISFVTNKLNNLFIGTSQGIYYSEDEGTTWHNVLPDSIVTTLMKDNQDFLYAGTDKGTFLRSIDNGMSWQNKNDNLYNKKTHHFIL